VGRTNAAKSYAEDEERTTFLPRKVIAFPQRGELANDGQGRLGIPRPTPRDPTGEPKWERDPGSGARPRTTSMRPGATAPLPPATVSPARSFPTPEPASAAKRETRPPRAEPSVFTPARRSNIETPATIRLARGVVSQAAPTVKLVRSLGSRPRLILGATLVALGVFFAVGIGVGRISRAASAVAPPASGATMGPAIAEVAATAVSLAVAEPKKPETDIEVLPTDPSQREVAKGESGIADPSKALPSSHVKTHGGVRVSHTKKLLASGPSAKVTASKRADAPPVASDPPAGQGAASPQSDTEAAAASAADELARAQLEAAIH
jgi:hypothetical protein